MPASRKLTDKQVTEIRRRVRKGEQQSALAVEFGVNRKTIRRRLTELERVEAENAQQRLRRQAARERRKLLDREQGVEPSPSHPRDRMARTRLPERARPHDRYAEWLETPKNLPGRARAEASGLVRVRNPDATFSGWVERADVGPLLEEGWKLA
jgi:hypothetical protein